MIQNWCFWREDLSSLIFKISAPPPSFKLQCLKKSNYLFIFPQSCFEVSEFSSWVHFTPISVPQHYYSDVTNIIHMWFRITKCLSWDYNFYSQISNECKSNIYHVTVIKIYKPPKMFILKQFFLKNILGFLTVTEQLWSAYFDVHLYW